MALVAVDCLAPRTRWPRGLLVGIAAAIKLTPAAFVLFFLLRRDVRAAVVTVVTAAVATGIGFAVDPASSARYWFGGPASGVSGSVFYTNQTIQAVLARAEVPALAAKAVWLVATVALLVLIVPVVRRAEPALALVTVAGFALLVSPTSWSHHWVWIAPALLVVVVEAVRRRSRGWAAAAAVLAVTFYLAPFRFLPHEHDQELAWTRRAAGGGGDVRDRRDPRAGGGAAGGGGRGPGGGRVAVALIPARCVRAPGPSGFSATPRRRSGPPGPGSSSMTSRTAASSGSDGHAEGSRWSTRSWASRAAGTPSTVCSAAAMARDASEAVSPPPIRAP